MFQTTRFSPLGGTLVALVALVALAVAMAGCSARTNVSATGSTPAQFTHLYITTQEVWFNTSATASADDAGWSKFTLKTPVTVDLVTQSNGTLGEIANDLRVAPGTYNSILLLPVDNSTAATASALAVGASTNMEADYQDATGSHTVPLTLPNPEKGIIVPGSSLTVPVGGSSGAGIGAIGAAASSSTTGTTNSATTLFGQPTTVNSTTTTGSTTNTNNTITVSFATNFDANRDLHLFSYGPDAVVQTGVLFSTSPVSSDLAKSGGITGTLTLTSLTNITNQYSNRVAIQACAESVSADSTHHFIVACAPVQTDGTFTIYPLPSNSRTPAVYDVVIHGPNIAAIIIKNIAVVTTTPSLTAAASTAGSVATTTASGAVSLGTFIPRPSTSYVVNITPSATAALPPGAAATFYQTLSAKSEIPYAIDEVGIDPFNLTLQTAEPLATNTVDSGTYSSNGGTITTTSSTPVEGLGAYKVGGTAPLFTDAVSGTVVQPPASAVGTNAASTTTPVTVAVPNLSPANGSSVASITASVTQTSPGVYDQGALIVAHNGAVVGTASLSTALSGSGSVVVNGLPSGSDSVYNLSVIVWNSGHPADSFKHESIATPVNLSGGSATGVAVNID